MLQSLRTPNLENPNPENPLNLVNLVNPISGGRIPAVSRP